MKNTNLDPIIIKFALYAPDTSVKIWFFQNFLIKYGNFLCRVPIDIVIPDIVGEEIREEEFIEPMEESETLDQFSKEETPVIDMTNDLEIARENTELKSKVSMLEDEVLRLREQDLNSEEVHEAGNDVEMLKDDSVNLDINMKKKMRRERQKAKKLQSLKLYPKLSQFIQFKEKGSNIWIKGKVYGVYKKNSVYKTFKQVELEDGSCREIDFANDIEDWKPVIDDARVTGVSDDEVVDSFPIEIVKRSQFKDPEVIAAMHSEIEKFKHFEAIEEVEDVGQHRIPIRWVVTRNDMDGQNQPLKARLCVRSDLELDKDLVRSDSPTAGK